MTRKKTIIAFCCENSAYKAAEPILGASFMKSVEVVKLTCAGKVQVSEILKCFENGAENVLILGCPIDNCQYLKGNIRAQKRVNVARQALKDAGIDENRLKIEFISSLDRHKLAEIIKKIEAATNLNYSGASKTRTR